VRLNSKPLLSMTLSMEGFLGIASTIIMIYCPLLIHGILKKPFHLLNIPLLLLQIVTADPANCLCVVCLISRMPLINRASQRKFPTPHITFLFPKYGLCVKSFEPTSLCPCNLVQLLASGCWMLSQHLCEYLLHQR